MNQKAAKFARRVNRLAGTLAKKSDETNAASLTPKPTKLPRKVKRWYASLDHKTKGKARNHWRAGLATIGAA